MEQRVFMNSINKKFHTYVNSKSGKPIKAISEWMIKADILPV